MSVKRQLSIYNGNIEEIRDGDSGHHRYKTRNVAINANALDEDSIIFDTDSGDKTYTLEASPETGRRRRIKNNGSSQLSIDGNGNNVNGFSILVLKNKKSTVEIEFDGAEWG